MASDFLQWFSGASREGCFFDADGRHVDVAILCHEVKNLLVSADEQVFFSVRDRSKPRSEETATLGTACIVRRASIDTTLVVRIWAGHAGSRSTNQGHVGSPRVCGELPLPLAWLVSRSSGLLVQTWLPIDVDGDTLSESLDTASTLTAADRRLNRAVTGRGPRVCLTACRASELGSTRRLALSSDATTSEQKAVRWPALVISQRQHMTLSRVLHAKATGVDSDDDDEIADQADNIQARLRAQASEIEDLHQELLGEVGETHEEEHEQDKTMLLDLQKLLDEKSEEANRKIDASNETIIELRRARTAAKTDKQQLEQERAVVESEIRQLEHDIQWFEEQKVGLLEIMKELDGAVEMAGSGPRRSIDRLKEQGYLS